MEDTVVRSPAPRRSSRRLSGCLGALLNVLSLVCLLATCLNALIIAAVFQNPGVLALAGGQSFMPATQPRLLSLVGTATAVAAVQTQGGIFPTLPPEWTPTAVGANTATPLPTATPVNTSTPLPKASRTPTVQPTGPTPTASPTLAPFSYTLQNEAAAYRKNDINSSGCSWFGIAGQAFGLNGRPVIGLTVHLEGDGLSLDALTGSQPAIGAGGYEIPLGNKPVASTTTYRLQLRNNTGTALSDNYVIETFDDCNKNLVMVSFVQNH